MCSTCGHVTARAGDFHNFLQSGESGETEETVETGESGESGET